MGDFVLEVGGVWDLREPLGNAGWGVLVWYIREKGWLLGMVVADGEGQGGTSSEEEEKEDQRVKNGDAGVDYSMPQ